MLDGKTAGYAWPLLSLPVRTTHFFPPELCTPANARNPTPFHEDRNRFARNDPSRVQRVYGYDRMDASFLYLHRNFIVDGSINVKKKNNNNKKERVGRKKEKFMVILEVLNP